MKNKSKINVLIILIMLVIAVWAISGVLIIKFLTTWTDRGTFGDLFGAVNALFSGLAFAVLIYTIVLHRDEMKENRKEILLNKKNLERNAELQLKAHEVLIQQVEQTHLSAKMSAMKTLVDYYNNKISDPKSSEDVIEQARNKRRKIINQIDELIDGIDNSNVD